MFHSCLRLNLTDGSFDVGIGLCYNCVSLWQELERYRRASERRMKSLQLA